MRATFQGLVVAPELPCAGGGLPMHWSRPGQPQMPMLEVRDPALLVDDGILLLACAWGGERAISMAPTEVTQPATWASHHTGPA